MKDLSIFHLTNGVKANPGLLLTTKPLLHIVKVTCINNNAKKNRVFLNVTTSFNDVVSDKKRTARRDVHI